MSQSNESWNSRLGVILAVAGSAVGLGNFLRFPGQAAQFGGGAFMLAYCVAFLIIGLPICWAEWTIGRHGGKKGFHSSPGILNSIVGHSYGKYVGILGIVIPTCIYVYYVNVEAWTLGYAVNFFMQNMEFATAEDSTGFWAGFAGLGEDGAALNFSFGSALPYLLIVFAINFYLIFHGVSKGIETFCKVAIPILLVIAVIILVRVLTLGVPDPERPERNIANGLGYMWNPDKTLLAEKKDGAWEAIAEMEELVGPEMISAAEEQVAADPENLKIVERSIWSQMTNPDLWLAAAGQIFFSISIGFGIIINYASYLRENDDVVLSGFAATSANEFCEVGLGGLITLPAAVAFLGVAGAAGGTFGLGFQVLPLVFSQMTLGWLFGGLFFFLLFLAAVTSSISMVQPVIAFIEEALDLNRKQSIGILGIITALCAMVVLYFSNGIKAIDTLDYWSGTFLIFVLAMAEIIIFSWVFGAERGVKEANRGAIVKIPHFFVYIMKYVCPLFLLTIFTLWCAKNIFGATWVGGTGEKVSYVIDLFYVPNQAAWISVTMIMLIGLFTFFLLKGSPKYKDHLKQNQNS
ncbi:MAG: sodium:calcium symporter [Verrucomicrobiota bacterium]